MIKIAVCDDELSVRKEIKDKVFDYFKNARFTLHIQTFENGAALLNSEDEFDIVFLDIQMGNIDGMTTARKLREKNYKGFLIFITQLDELVYDSFEVSAFDYLVKPLDEAKLNKTLSRLTNSINGTATNLLVKSDGESRLVQFSDIVYFEVIGKKIYIHTENGEVIAFYESIEKLESKLDKRFFKCHRSYLVNLDYIEKFGKTARVKSGEEIPISRLRQKEFIAAVAEYVGE